MIVYDIVIAFTTLFIIIFGGLIVGWIYTIDIEDENISFKEFSKGVYNIFEEGFKKIFRL